MEKTNRDGVPRPEGGAPRAGSEGRGPTVVPFPAPGGAPPPRAAAFVTTGRPPPVPNDASDDVTRRTAAPPPNREGPPASLRLSAAGRVMAGDAPPELIESVAYAAQMADVVGELIGIDGFVSIEVATSRGACVVGRQSNGDVVAMAAGHAVDATTLKRLLGL